MKEADVGNRIRVRQETGLQDVRRKGLSSSSSRKHGMSISSSWSIYSKEKGCSQAGLEESKCERKHPSKKEGTSRKIK